MKRFAAPLIYHSMQPIFPRLYEANPTLPPTPQGRFSVIQSFLRLHSTWRTPAQGHGGSRTFVDLLRQKPSRLQISLRFQNVFYLFYTNFPKLVSTKAVGWLLSSGFNTDLPCFVPIKYLSVLFAAMLRDYLVSHRQERNDLVTNNRSGTVPIAMYIILPITL